MGAALFIYLKCPQVTRRLRIKCAGLYSLMLQKFKIDELYECLFIRPIRWISDEVLSKIIDQKFIDGFLVHGFSGVAKFFGQSLSMVQTGFLGSYLTYMLMGLIAILAYMLWF